MLTAGLSVAAETVALTPGALPGQVKRWKTSCPVDLQLQGEVTAVDLVSLKYLPASVESLDLSGLTIKGIVLKNSKYMGRAEFSDGEIPSYSLFATNVKTVKLPSSVTVIGEAAFAETPLATINFPASLTKIEPRAFYRCKYLTAADLSSTSVRVIPEQCFYGCVSMKRMTVPSSVSEVCNRSLMKSGVESLDISGISTVGDYAFAEMPSLAEVTLRNGVILGEGAFFGDGLLGRMAGMPSNSAALMMANSGVCTIYGSIGGNVVEEGAYANLKVDTIVIHPSVKEIKGNAFRNMCNLKSVDVSERGKDVPPLSPDAFSGVDVSKVSLVMAKDDEEAWRAAPVWQDFKIGADVTGIEDTPSEGVRIYVLGDCTQIEVRSNCVIDDVAVYSLSGMTLHESKPAGTTCTAGPFSEKGLLVRVNAGGVTKVVKVI